MTRAARVGVVVAAVALVLPVAWWLSRPDAEPVAAASLGNAERTPPRSEALPRSPREEPAAAPPPRKPARRPPRFVRAPAATPTHVARTGNELNRENPLVLDAISKAAHGRGVTEAEFRAGSACIRDFGRRNPAAIQPDNTVRGVYVVTIETKDEQGRVVHIEGRGREDADMFDCLRRNRTWLSGQPFPAPGAPDGTTTLEWPYRIAIKTANGSSQGPVM